MQKEYLQTTRINCNRISKERFTIEEKSSLLFNVFQSHILHIFNIKMILSYEINFIKIIFAEDFYWKIIKMNCKLWTTFGSNAEINTDQCHNKRKYFLQLYRFGTIYKK